MNKENFKNTKAPSIIWRLPLSPTEKIILFNLAYFEKDGVIEDKSQALIGYIVGTTQPSVVRCMNNLEENGWISRRKAFAKSDSYSISWDKISEYCKDSDLASYSPSNTKDNIQPQQEEEKPTESIKTNITIEEIEEIMGNYIGEVEKLNNKTTGENSNFNFESIDRLIPKMNKMMALRQIRTYLSEEENIKRLNDALSIFLNGISNDDKYKYYNSILSQAV
jgi:predicted transcriptional regulator